ncbi:Wzz/FepE/Etk N-terminal domain-containing protein [Peribacillus alkalitolerans]|uniref:Wzz/FepE/Etk N-terminal domain-containing protein n=1 Tax=Peribacillus alkalitolerans TaxID=1550385 RepID=UPI0013D03D0B|nr:Wzz/FepE/Etk N-terminal domain-containing protein [Peribacillus alkalitolerans]
MNKAFLRYLRNIGNRARKLLWLIILIPVLTAGLAYFLSADTKPVYQANAKLLLGNFQNDEYTNATYLSKFVPTEYFLNNLKGKYNLDINPETMNSQLKVNDTGDKTVTLTLSGPNQEEAQETLKLITMAILSESTAIYESKVALIRERITETEALKESSEPATAQQLLYDLKMDNRNIKNTILLEDVESAPLATLSAINKAILGFLAGIMVSLMILVLPELFREED